MKQTNHVYIIAEAGVNHNGSIKMAKELIDVATDAGVDAIKFQTFNANKIVCKNTPKADYQVKSTNVSESQLEMLKKLELDTDAHRILIDHCKNNSIDFLSTPFDISSIDLLTRELNLPIIKIPSGEITNAPFLIHIARTGKPVILSTGMSTLSDIETALGILAFGYLKQNKKPSVEYFQEAYSSKEGQEILQKNVVLLHCTTEYPASFNQVNLKAMDTIQSAFGLSVGLSDHTTGIAISIAAAALGASVIEKHLTLDRNLPGPDHKASLEPKEFKEMVLSIRQVTEALGNSIKVPSISEFKNKVIVRKSIVAACEIKQGQIFSESNLDIKRPGNGLSPLLYWECLGKKANKDYQMDELITL